jgi:hypothetical protein
MRRISHLECCSPVSVGRGVCVYQSLTVGMAILIGAGGPLHAHAVCFFFNYHIRRLEYWTSC